MKQPSVTVLHLGYEGSSLGYRSGTAQNLTWHALVQGTVDSLLDSQIPILFKGLSKGFPILFMFLFRDS